MDLRWEAPRIPPQRVAQVERAPELDRIGGATGGVTATAPVVPGETIDLRIMVRDTSDDRVDTIPMLDGFEWTGGSDAAVPLERRPPVTTAIPTDR